MTQIHPSAVVHKDAQLADDVVVGPNSVIDSGVSIGSGTILVHQRLKPGRAITLC